MIFLYQADKSAQIGLNLAEIAISCRYFFAKCSYALYNFPQEVHEYECNERRDPCSSRRSPSDEL